VVLQYSRTKVQQQNTGLNVSGLSYAPSIAKTLQVTFQIPFIFRARIQPCTVTKMVDAKTHLVAVVAPYKIKSLFAANRLQRFYYPQKSWPLISPSKTRANRFLPEKLAHFLLEHNLCQPRLARFVPLCILALGTVCART